MKCFVKTKYEDVVTEVVLVQGITVNNTIKSRSVEMKIQLTLCCVNLGVYYPPWFFTIK